ncbi:MAG: hypothetical protein IT385_06270 [Deltaproteobacteria bacterium]|nr:hypothetical protein [Deltaproteobacteria bacterium]
MVTRTQSRAQSGQATLADEWDAIHTILAPLLAEVGAADRRASVLARYHAPRMHATLHEVDQVIDQLLARMRTEPKAKTREETRQVRAPTQPPANEGAPDRIPRVPTPPIGAKPITRPETRPAARPTDKTDLDQRAVVPPLPPPIPMKAPPTRPAMPASADELEGVPPLPPVDAQKKRPTGVRPVVGFDESGPVIAVRAGTAPETYRLYDDIVNLSGLNDWDGVLISLERLLVLAKLEDHIKDFVDANEVKLLSIYETFLKSFARVPKRLPPAIDNSMPRSFLRAEKIATVLGLIDNQIAIQELLRRSPLTPLETCSALCQLRRSGIIEVP